LEVSSASEHSPGTGDEGHTEREEWTAGVSAEGNQLREEGLIGHAEFKKEENNNVHGGRGRPYFLLSAHAITKHIARNFRKNGEKGKQRAKRSTSGDRGIEMLGSSAGGNKREKHGRKKTPRSMDMKTIKKNGQSNRIREERGDLVQELRE
jgi:hypothetical protein